LHYETKNDYKDHKDVECVKKGHFNHYLERKNYAMDQLKTIGQYVQDFGSIIKRFPPFDKADK